MRKTLGQHEIATMQTTMIEQATGLLNLTTVLAHASGEWIASDWPVCSIADIASPQRMGAALTYARRYALFTLVGIAGEDDLDAPDLCDGPLSLAERPFKPNDNQSERPLQTHGNEHARHGRKGGVPITLGPEQSAASREKLLIEVGNIISADLAAAWAREALTVKNSLMAADAKLVEDAFERRLSEFPSSETTTLSNDDPSAPQIDAFAATESRHAGLAKGIDKSILTVAAPRRYRNREDLRYVAQQACLVCGRKPSDPHHLGFTQPRALGRKVSDEFAVPLCRGHHRGAHRARDERAWWRQAGIDPIKVARGLWKTTRDWESDGLNDLHYLGGMTLPRPLTERTRTSAPPQRRNEKLPCRIFPASGQRAACSGIATMWRPNEPVENIPDLPGNAPQNKRRRARRHPWRDGFADQTVVKTLENVRSYRAFECAVVASADPRSMIELALAHRLASLLWRLRRAGAIETGLFKIQGELLSARRQASSSKPSQAVPTATGANGHSKSPTSNGRPDQPARDQELPSTSMRPRLRPSHAVAQCFLRISNLDPTLLDRVGSYEARLWRQAAQTIWSLEAMRQPQPPIRQRLRHRAAPFTWDWQK